jgi:phosphoglycerate dehydrogenase-like enzyme
MGTELFRVAISGDFLNEQGEDAYGELPVDRLDAAPHVAWHYLRDQGPRPGDADYWNQFYRLKMTAEQLAGVDGLILLRPWLTREVLEQVRDRLVVVARSGAGYDKVDVAACTDHDVVLTNAPLALNHATASTALLFILALAKRLKAQERITRAGRWDLQPAEMGDEIQGRVLGVVGLGHSGRELVRLAAPFEMQVLAYSPHADPAEARRLGVELVSLERLLSESDFVSVHARPRPENKHLMGAAQFAQMKPTAMFVNIARGDLVDQPALVHALRTGQIAGAGLDVFAIEPLPVNDPLLELDNVIVTPHWNASTRDVWRATGDNVTRSVLAVSRGEFPAHIVNPEVLERPGFQRKLAHWKPA